MQKSKNSQHVQRQGVLISCIFISPKNFAFVNNGLLKINSSSRKRGFVYFTMRAFTFFARRDFKRAAVFFLKIFFETALSNFFQHVLPFPWPPSGFLRQSFCAISLAVILFPLLRLRCAARVLHPCAFVFWRYLCLAYIYYE